MSGTDAELKAKCVECGEIQFILPLFWLCYFFLFFVIHLGRWSLKCFLTIRNEPTNAVYGL